MVSNFLRFHTLRLQFFKRNQRIVPETGHFDPTSKYGNYMVINSGNSKFIFSIIQRPTRDATCYVFISIVS